MYGSRVDVPTVTVLLTNGKSDDSIVQSSRLLRNKSKVITVGLSDSLNMAEMRQISSTPLSHTIKSLGSFEELELFEDEILESVCTLQHISQLKHSQN